MYANTRSSTGESPPSRLSWTALQTPAEKPPDCLTCRECGAEIPKSDRSERVCPECHLVQTDRPLSTTPRPHHGNDARKRTGSRVTNLWADRGLGTGFGTDVQTGGAGLTQSSPQHRLSRNTGWTHGRTAEQCRLDYALGEIRRMGAAFDVPTPELEEAARFYRKAKTAGSITGRSVEGFVTACLLASIRQSPHRIPVSGRELRNVSRATDDQIRVARGALTAELGITIPPERPETFLPKAVSELSVPTRVERRAKEILRTYIDGDGAHRGTSPRTLAAGALHAAYECVEWDRRPTLDALANVFDVARSTISTEKGELLDNTGVVSTE